MTDSPSEIVPPDWQNWSASKPSVIRPLAGGLTNQSFLLSAGEEQLVLRRNSAISGALDLNRTAEHQALLHAHSAGLCAPLVYCDPDHRYLVTRYIAGETWNKDGAGALQQLAQLVRRIHALPAIDAQLDIEAKAASYWRSIDARADFYRDLRELDRSVQQHIATAKSLSEGFRLCHNDLLATNLIAQGGNLYAIDWEYAAMGDPFHDLAVIVEEYGLDKQQQQCLLAEYLGRSVTPTDRQRLDHWRVIYGYLSALWYAVQWSTGRMRQSTINDVIASRIRNLSFL